MKTATRYFEEEVLRESNTETDWHRPIKIPSVIEDIPSWMEDNEMYYEDSACEVRGYAIITDVPSPSDRHMESRSEALECEDGTWIGWTYWYGGGKHSEEEMDEDIYFLNVTEEEKLVTVRTFTKC